MVENNAEEKIQCFRGLFLHSTRQKSLEILHDKFIGIQRKKIIFIEDGSKAEEIQLAYGINDEDIRVLQNGEFMIPGFIDTHVHASQYPFAGTNLDLGLLDWLLRYTLPTEAKFGDLKFARRSYKKVIKRVLKNGTTTASYFATVHSDASLELCDVIEKYGQRAFVGKVNMDQNTPDYCQEGTEESLRETERFINAVLQRKYSNVSPIITPRFAVSCSKTLMTKLGDLAKKYDLLIQSHLSETIQECDLVRRLFPDMTDYTSTYDKTNLLTDKTVMAHGIYLSDGELDLIKTRNTGISHCPNSNLSIRSGLLDVQKLLNRGIKVGLGTVLNLDHKLGNFEIGKEFDALLVDWSVEDGPFDVFEEDDTIDIFQKFIFLGDDRNIKEVYVGGQRVLPRIDKEIS